MAYIREVIKKVYNIGEDNERNSSFELLRIICIWGIINLHTFGRVYGSVTGGALIYGVIINSVFNMGVSLFMLISGYFGVKSSSFKMVSVWGEALFYSVGSVILLEVLGIQSLELKELIKAFFPFSNSAAHWYISTYLLLLMFAKYINGIAEKLTKKEFEHLLFIMLIIFSLLPTITQLHIMRDMGKGPMNMLLVYLVGRYIRKYLPDKEVWKRSRICVSLLCVIGLEVFLNIFYSFFRHNGKGLSCPFACDYSLFILLGSVLTFILFMDLRFHSKAINKISKHVLGIYLFEKTIRALLDHWEISVVGYVNQWYLGIAIAIYAVLVMAICIVIDVIRECTVGKLVTWLYDRMIILAEGNLHMLKNKVCKWINGVKKY